MNNLIDMRSDTITSPTEEMMQAIATAKLGDDVMREDASTRELEAFAAQLTGKEAGLLVTSGTMGNLVALLTHCGSGRPEIIAEASSHIILSEAGNYARLASVASRQIEGKNGLMDPEDIENAIRDEDNLHHPKTALICVENTHNRGGGTVYTTDRMAAIHAVAKRHGVPMHLDGARLFNASVALGIKAVEITCFFDSVQLCLSKGLSAPIGSILVGDRAFIEEARHFRKMLGGGMRQCGIISAAGLVALQSMTDRLREDHAHARRLGEGIAAIGAPVVDLGTVQTNMVRVSTQTLSVTAAEFVARLKEEGLWCGAQSKYDIRFMTHRHTTSKDVDSALVIIKKVVSDLRKRRRG